VSGVLYDAEQRTAAIGFVDFDFGVFACFVVSCRASGFTYCRHWTAGLATVEITDRFAAHGGPSALIFSTFCLSLAPVAGYLVTSRCKQFVYLFHNFYRTPLGQKLQENRRRPQKLREPACLKGEIYPAGSMQWNSKLYKLNGRTIYIGNYRHKFVLQTI
jgi:hypothetical protein